MQMIHLGVYSLLYIYIVYIDSIIKKKVCRCKVKLTGSPATPLAPRGPEGPGTPWKKMTLYNITVFTHLHALSSLPSWTIAALTIKIDLSC